MGVTAGIRILFLEDSADDAELVEHALRESGIVFTIERVADESSFAKALGEFVPALILADYKLPGFDGLEALALARQHCRSTPFIFVSDVLGEDTAVETLQRGATDYVLKDRLERLVPAVRRALQRPPADLSAQESERRFQALTETLPAIVFVHQDGKFRYLNPAAERILGYPMEKLLTMDFWEVLHPDCRELVRSRGLARQKGEPLPSRYPFQILRPDGETRWLDCSAIKIDFDGSPAVLGSAFDITESKRVADALRESEARFASFMHHLPGAAWMKDLEGRYVYANEMAEKAFGKPLSELRGRTDQEIFPSETAALFQINDQQALDSGQCLETIETLSQEDGVHHSIVRKFPFFGEPGEPALVAGVAFDVTKLLRAEEALRQSEESFRLLVESAPTAMLMVDATGRITLVNSQVESLFGYGRDELLGKAVEMLIPDRYRAGHRAHRLSFVQAAEARAMGAGRDLFGLRQDQTEVPIEIALKPMHMAGETFVLASIIDISERKKAEARRAAFSTLAHSISAVSTPREAARLILGIASDLFGWDACYLHLLSAKGEIVPVLTVDTLNGQRADIPPTSFTLDPSPMMRRVIEGGAQLINRDSPPASPEDLIPFGDTRRRSASLMYIPIRSGTRVIGVLSIQSYTPRAYDAEALNTLQALADHCGEALARIDAAETLRKSEARNRALLDALPDFMFRLHNDGTILDFRAPRDAAFADGAQISSPENSVAPPWQELAQETVRVLQQSGHFGAPRSFEFRCSLLGEEWDLEARVGVSGPDELLVIVRDVTDRKRLELEVLEISARERRRLGHDLHDGLGQYLAGVAVQAKLLEEDLTRDSSPRQSAARQLVQLINDSIGQVRDVARGLDPIEVEVRGLLPALQKLALEFADRFGTDCQFHCSQTDLPLSQFASLQLYRIAQEAITNAAKHGDARHILIDLNEQPEGLRLCVSDDGRGFDANPELRLGMGLRIMRHRAHAIGGVLNIHSRPDCGTEVECVMPTSAIPRSNNPEPFPSPESES